MTALTIQDVSRRSGLSEPTLRYYEEVGLIGPVDRDASSGHRRYRDEDLDTLQALACLRALGVGIEDMRTYQANRSRGQAAAAEQRDLLLRHAERIEAEIVAQQTRLWLPAREGGAVGRPRPRRRRRRGGGAAGKFGRGRLAWGCGDEPGPRHRRIRLRGHAADRRAAAGREPGARHGALDGRRGRAARGGAPRRRRRRRPGGRRRRPDGRRRLDRRGGRLRGGPSRRLAHPVRPARRTPTS